MIISSHLYLKRDISITNIYQWGYIFFSWFRFR